MIYLILVNISLLIFFCLYHFLFRKMTFFQANRVFLLSAAVISLLVPLFQFVNMDFAKSIQEPLGLSGIIMLEPIQLSLGGAETQRSIPWITLLWTIYSIGVLFSLGKLAWRYQQLQKALMIGDVAKGSFSFFKHVFVGADVADQDTVRKHEQVHVDQGHTYDLFLLELVCAINWFNPIGQFYLKEMKFQHECIADQLCSTDKVYYAELLVANAMNVRPETLINEFSNHSLLKRRIKMLFQKPTAQRKQVWYLLAAPALAFVAIGALLFNPNMANALQKQQATPIIQTADIAIAKDAGVEGPAQEGRKTLQGKVSSELPKLTQKDTNDVFTSVEISPEPVGGLTAFRKWVSDNYKYPQAAIDAELKGQILVSYIVEKDGSLTNIKIVKDLGHGSGEALVDVLKKAKPWKAGIQNGKKVRVSFQLPMTLNIGE